MRPPRSRHGIRLVRGLAAFTRRLAAALLVVVGVLAIAFLALDALPGDGARPDADPRISVEQRQRLRAIYGLDDPAWQRGLRWIEGVATGDLGISLSRQRPVVALLRSAIGPTLRLAFAALALELLLGVLLGVIAARRPGSFADRVVGLLSVLLYSVPTFWLALVALLLFAIRWPILPAGPGLADGPIQTLLLLALPAAVLAATGIGAVARFTRDGMVETLAQDFIRAERARGLSETRVFLHALETSAGPLVQWTGLELPRLVSGALVVEVVFSWPGLGRLAYDGLLARDTPLVLGTTALTAVLVLAGTWSADLLQAALDPRIRRPSVGGAMESGG